MEADKKIISGHNKEKFQLPFIGCWKANRIKNFPLMIGGSIPSPEAFRKR